MALYDKKILYLDYLENGKKVKNAGFAKVEVRDGCCRILLNVKGTYDTDSLRAEVVLLTDVGEVVTDHFVLNRGTGTYLTQMNPENMADKGITYEECLGVGVRISEHRVVQATWRELLIPPEILLEPESEEDAEVEVVSQFIEEPTLEDVSGNMPEPEPIVERMPSEEFVEEDEKVEVESEKKTQNPVIYDNKWRQLCQMFESIQPFHDERSYLSITPRDFVVLTREFQPMVNNSFLLHGFYNYKHIILGKEESSREERYYIGVPGVYYDREKQVAVMFGFESFESETEPAVDGGFGYYMKRVDI